MPTQFLTEEIYRIYDTAVAKTMENLIDRSPYYDTIRLVGFDKKNKEHLFVLRVALIVRDLYHIPVEIGVHWWEGIAINWKIHKKFGKVKIVNRYATSSIWTPHFVEKIKLETNTEHNCQVRLDHIYDTYYEGSCD